MIGNNFKLRTMKSNYRFPGNQSNHHKNYNIFDATDLKKAYKKNSAGMAAKGRMVREGSREVGWGTKN